MLQDAGSLELCIYAPFTSQSEELKVDKRQKVVKKTSRKQNSYWRACLETKLKVEANMF